MKYATIRVFTDRFLPYKDIIVDSVCIWENKVSEKPYSRIFYAVIFSVKIFA